MTIIEDPNMVDSHLYLYEIGIDPSNSRPDLSISVIGQDHAGTARIDNDSDKLSPAGKRIKFCFQEPYQIAPVVFVAGAELLNVDETGFSIVVPEIGPHSVAHLRYSVGGLLDDGDGIHYTEASKEFREKWEGPVLGY